MSAQRQKFLRKLRASCRQRGGSLIEMMIAVLVLLMGIAPLTALFTVAVSQNSGQVDIATRTAHEAQDKMEQLVALNFSDGASNTAVYPTANTGGTGLGGVMGINATVGGVNPAAPVASYVDYVTFQGALQTTATGAQFRRQWSISTDAVNGTLKTITVVVTVVGWTGRGLAPSTTLVCMKTNN